MEQESTFRWAILVVVVITLTIAGYHRIQARVAGGPVSRREEGFALLAMRTVFGLSLWVAIIAYLVSPDAMAWSALPAADWLRYGGVGLGLLGCGVLYWTLHHLGPNLTDTVVTRAEATLVTSGPYRWARHPIHAVMFVWVPGFFLATGDHCLRLWGSTVDIRGCQGKAWVGEQRAQTCTIPC